MALVLPDVIKNSLRNKWLETKLFLTREPNQITDFFRQLSELSRVLILLPRDRAEEVYVRKYVTEIRAVFKGSRITVLDVPGLREYDSNWLGIPTDHFFEKIREDKFDLFIDLNSVHDQLCSYICLNSGASLRLHLVPGKYDKIYNLQIRVPEATSLDNRFRNLINYLYRLRGVNADSKIPA